MVPVTWVSSTPVFPPPLFPTLWASVEMVIFGITLGLMFPPMWVAEVPGLVPLTWVCSTLVFPPPIILALWVGRVAMAAVLNVLVLRFPPPRLPAGPHWLKMVPKWSPKVPKWSQKVPQRAQRYPNGVKIVLKGAKRCPNGAQKSRKGAQMEPKYGPSREPGSGHCSKTTIFAYDAHAKTIAKLDCPRAGSQKAYLLGSMWAPLGLFCALFEHLLAPFGIIWPPFGHLLGGPGRTLLKVSVLRGPLDPPGTLSGDI